MPQPPNLISEAGAERLKARIEAYWKQRGGDVVITTQPGGFKPALRSAHTDVRSNMINGLPLNLAKPAKRPEYQP